MALLNSSWLYVTLQWFYFTLFDSPIFYHWFDSLYSTLHYSTMTKLHSTWLYVALSWLYVTLLYSTLHYQGFTLLYTLIYHGSTSFYLILCITLQRTYFTVLYPTLLYHGLTSLFLTLHYSKIWLYFTLLYSTLLRAALLHSIWLYITPPWIYCILHFSTVALLHSPWL